MGNISLWQEIRQLYHMFTWVTMAPPYGSEYKGWREIYGNFCANMICLAHGSSYGMVAIGDTLYVANKEALLKFPLKDLDEAISDQESYPMVD